MKTLYRTAMVIALAALLAGCKSELYSGLQEREVNEMISVLAASHISAQRQGNKDGAYAISVEGDDMAAAIATLSARGLPRAKYETLGKIFQGGGMVATPFEERARFMYALDQELSQSISQISGVSSARVHVILPETSPFDTKQERPRASVFIYLNPGIEFGNNVATIKTLIVNAVNGLAYEDVAVALFTAAASVPSAPSTRAPWAGTNLFWSGLSLVALAGAVLYGTRQRRVSRPQRMN